MSQRPVPIAAAGGLNQVTSAMLVPPGQVIGVLNFECADNGYRRVDGYERYDGRGSPTAAGLLVDDDERPAVVEAARAPITAVPGSGPVRGVVRFGGVTYAWRDNAGANAGVMYRATPTGWQQVSTAFPAGGRYQFQEHNFLATSSGRRLFGANGVGKSFQVDGDGAVTFITSGFPDDKPTRVTVFKESLVLAFRGGTAGFSGPGDPTAWDATGGAQEVGFGDEIADFIINSDSLTVLCLGSVHSIVGDDAANRQKQPLTDEAGALPYTAQRLGVAMYLDNAGIRSVTATNAYGNFKIGTLTPQIQPALRAKRQATVSPVASIITRSKDLYRLFYSDGTGVSVYMGRKTPEAMLFDLGRPVTCIFRGDDADGRERTLFGSDNGFVYELDVGVSFDGGKIDAYLQFAFASLGGPRALKRWHSLILELASSPKTKLGITGEFDYAGGEQPALTYQGFTIQGGGALWNTDVWDTFYWSSPLEGEARAFIDGQGRNLSPIVVASSNEDPAFVIQVVIHNVTVRGQLR